MLFIFTQATILQINFNFCLTTLLMNRVESKTSYELYNSIDELPADFKNLMLKARNATKTAYAPYSNYFVGAAVLLENGSIIEGSNQENAAYPSGLCAERVAVFAAGAHNPDVKIKINYERVHLKSQYSLLNFKLCSTQSEIKNI